LQQTQVIRVGQWQWGSVLLNIEQEHQVLDQEDDDCGLVDLLDDGELNFAEPKVKDSEQVQEGRKTRPFIHVDQHEPQVKPHHDCQQTVNHVDFQLGRFVVEVNEDVAR
jgi:hypothetical protein